MSLRGIRGATSVEADRPELIVSATRELLESIIKSNPDLTTNSIASALFTTTEDLVTVHPALGARQMGWNQVPMMCAREIPVPGSLPRCIRVLIHWNTDREQEQIRHVYLHEAVKLRPDLCE